MPIVSSTHTVGHAQRDGRRYVVELHTDDAGVVHRVEYLAAEKADYADIMAARAVQIDASIVEAAMQKQEREASYAKVVAVLDTAVKAGALTKEEIEKAGYVLPPEKVAGGRQ